MAASNEKENFMINYNDYQEIWRNKSGLFNYKTKIGKAFEIKKDFFDKSETLTDEKKMDLEICDLYICYFWKENDFNNYMDVVKQRYNLKEPHDTEIGEKRTAFLEEMELLKKTVQQKEQDYLQINGHTWGFYPSQS